MKRFPALGNPAFRAFYFSQAVSLTGTWMQNLALPWLAYTLTGSPWLLGLVAAAQFLPTMLLSIFAGALTDRLNKVATVLSTQVCLAVASGLLTILVATGTATYPSLVAIALILGLANTLDFPARQAMVGELVGKTLLMNSVALNSSLFNLARIVGPALAGLTMGTWGIGWCFGLNTLSFVPAIVVLVLLQRKSPVRPAGAHPPLWRSAWEGVLYVAHDRNLRRVLVAVGLMSILGFNFSVVLPVLVKRVLGLGETEYGLLMSCMGLGSFVAAVTIAVRSHHGPRIAIFTLAPIVSGLLFVGLAFAPWIGLIEALMVLVGFSNIAFFTTANSYLQIHSRVAFRGRVMAFYALLFGGMAPVGSLIMGALVESGGPFLGFFVTGAALVLIFVVLAIWSPQGQATQAANQDSDPSLLP